MKSVEWTRGKGYASDTRTVKHELLGLLRILHVLGIKSVVRTEYGYIFEDICIIHP